MDLLLAYDVATDSAAGRRRLRLVAKACESYGVRVQDSVFDLVLDDHELESLVERLSVIIDHRADNVRIYRVQGREPVRVLGRTLPVSTTRGPLVL
jgi:CRISPR-associated protein Cas2